jgi:hypothetical protein
MKNGFFNSGICILMFLILAAPTSNAGVRDDVGWTALQTELGGAMPTGVGISISQVEGPVGATNNYFADTTDPELVGKAITLKSGLGGIPTGHATWVAKNYCGSTNGMSPGTTQIDAYEANWWLNNSVLNSGSVPAVETRRVQNHSWIYYTSAQNTNFTLSQTTAEDIIRRLDFSIQRDGFLAIVGLNNGTAPPAPALLNHSYNAISVGNKNGGHSSGGTTFDAAGRIKPEIVTPSVDSSGNQATSYACGVVSGAAAQLLQVADSSSAYVNARTNSEVIKALLLAGATKYQFPGWTRTTTQPLDLVYGAGQLNIYNSYKILVSGEKTASSSVTVSNRGWDFATTAASPARYFFDVPAGYALTNFSVVLTWNRKVVDSTPGPTFTPSVSVADMNLRLYNATGFTLGSLLDSSVSTNQNVEHIYATNLSAGHYALEVTSDTTTTDYALAWGGGLQPVVSIVTSASPTNWGTVSPASGTYPVGTLVNFTATPATYYKLSNWTGNLSGTNTSIPLTLTSNMTVTAVFAEKFTTNYPTPYWWLASYGYTSNQETVVTNIGANGHALWQSYIAGLVPTNPASQLKFTSQFLLNETNAVMTWNTVTGRLYTIWSSTNALTNYSPQSGASNMSATVQAFTNQIPPATPQKYYRLDAHLP